MFEFKLKFEDKFIPTQDALVEAVRKLVYDVADEILRRSQDNVPVSEGDLKKTGNVIKGDGWAIVGYNKEYAIMVHDGTKPHMPPVEALYPWVIKHPARTEIMEVDGVKIAVDAKRRYRKTKEIIPGRLYNVDPKVQRDAWALAMHIKKYGTKGQKYLEDAVEEVKAELAGHEHGRYLQVELRRRGVK